MPGIGSAFRSTFPLLLRGNSAMSMNRAGTIYSGSFDLRYSVNFALLYFPSEPTIYAINFFSEFLSSLALTRHCFIPSNSRITFSISPGSIRNPRIFTCSSARPRYSIVPSSSHLARSPLR